MIEHAQVYQLHSQLSQDSVAICMLPLCEVRLMNDANYPWVLLVPQVADTREIHQLSVRHQQALMREVAMVSRRLEALTLAEKMNVAALGNMVPQLHIHIIARFESDAAWPKPVWGVVPAKPYEKRHLDAFVSEIKAALNQG